MKLAPFWLNAALFAAPALTADVDPIVIKGSKFFFKSSGEEFFIRGVAYQQDMSTAGTISGNNSYVDPLADADSCKRDFPVLEQLGTNTIRVYAIDPTQDHDACMQMLQDAGIYVIADLSEPTTSINRDDPMWNNELYARYTSVVDSLAPYNNVIGFFAGNEVSNNNTNTPASAFVKAAVRDMKSYIKQKNYRPMGVGYATNDNADIRVNLAQYFNCDTQDDSIDFWGYNIYSWCGNSSFTQSGYDRVVEEFQTYSVPVFYAEYGCNEVKPRMFTEVQAIFGPQMTPVLSGGIVYMYFEEVNDFGLVNVDGDTVSKLPDFTYLSKEMALATPTGVEMNSYSPTNTALSPCPTIGSDWMASSKLPPTPNIDLCSCMTKSLTCTAKSSLSVDEVANLFGIVCGLPGNVCAGIARNAENGTYGAYGVCEPMEQLSFAFNAYYMQQAAKGNGQTACDFTGAATIQTPSKAEGNCDTLLKQAGAAGTGTVTSTPTGKSSSANPITILSVNLGVLQLSAYILCAMLSGAGMIFL